MKKLQLFALLLFLCNTLSAQEYIKIDNVINEVYYNYQFQPDSANAEKQDYRVMVLQIGKTHSKFTSVSRLESDSISYAVKDMERQTAMNIMLSHASQSPKSSFCSYNLIKDYPQKGAYELWGSFSEMDLKESGKLQFNWKLNTAEDTTILGFKCYKATCRFAGRDYTAWYAPSIPVSDGPYKFTGLPGLILSAADTKNQHRFNIYKIKYKVNREIFLYLKKENYKPTTPQNYVKAFYLDDKLLREQITNPDSPMRIQDDALRAKVLHKLNSRNNYIEQYR